MPLVIVDAANATPSASRLATPAILQYAIIFSTLCEEFIIRQNAIRKPFESDASLSSPNAFVVVDILNRNHAKCKVPSDRIRYRKKTGALQLIWNSGFFCMAIKCVY
jgi:hypothetical protein